jgi:hypothetical protein
MAGQTEATSIAVDVRIRCVTLLSKEDARHAVTSAPAPTKPKLIVDVLAGVPGCGKSTKMLSDAASTPGRYLFCLPTIPLIDEQARAFRKLNHKAECVPIHSKGRGRGTIARQIADLAQRSSNAEHLVAFITHEAMMDCDLAPFVGWHARIDEPPNAITCGRINIKQSVAAFQARFELELYGSGWSWLRPRFGRQPWNEIAKDALWRGLTDFLKLADRPQGVIIQLDDWAQAEEGGQLSWFSLWTPTQMHSFDSIVIAGASFLSSTAHRVLTSTFGNELEFRVSDVGSARSAQPRVRIMYFTKGHRGSTSFWSCSEGRKCLVAVERWLAQHVPRLGFWTGNEAVRHSMEHRVPGQMVLPKVAGLNEYRELDSCAIFYSSKPLIEDDTLKTVFELTDDDILVAREVEDIFQFVFRGALRNRDYAGAYDIYVYSLDQAERLQALMAENGLIDIDVMAMPDAGIMETTRPIRGTIAALSPPQAQARLMKKRADGARRSKESRARKKALKLDSLEQGTVPRAAK